MKRILIGMAFMIVAITIGNSNIAVLGSAKTAVYVVLAIIGFSFAYGSVAQLRQRTRAGWAELNRLAPSAEADRKKDDR